MRSEEGIEKKSFDVINVAYYVAETGGPQKGTGNMVGVLGPGAQPGARGPGPGAWAWDPGPGLACGNPTVLPVWYLF